MLNKEVLALGRKPDAFALVSQIDRERGKYVCRIYPKWEPGIPYRWGAIIGEIVHDLRSALDQLVSQLVVLNHGEPRKSHSFPIRSKEPSQGFAMATRYKRRDQRERLLYGPLFGVSDEAIAHIEGCQPYKREDGLLLVRLHTLWNLDKHRQLVPMHLIAQAPSVTVTDGVLTDRSDRFDGNTYVIEVSFARDGSGRDPQVQVRPHLPTDIAFSEQEIPVIVELGGVAQLIMLRLLVPLGELFPGESGIGLPTPDSLL
jgi:hypothetical protein